MTEKMPKLLKDCFSRELVESIAMDCEKQAANFNQSSFTNDVLTKDWPQLELKERMHRIADSLGSYLPSDYKQSISILLKVATNYSGLAHMCFPDFVEKFGQHDFETSMMALEQLTEGSSSEFAVRPFIILYPDLTMQRMKLWSKSANYHVRRLATEGCRPRLPWAIALPEFKRDPSAVLEIVMDLIDDDELYVRRSVANNLNDISKDNPQAVIAIASQYIGKSESIDWAIKHGCRGLLKSGNQSVLQIFGFLEPTHISICSLNLDENVNLEERLNFSFQLKSSEVKLGKLRVEFIIDFMKSNGKRAGKIFKICEGDYTENNRTVIKYYSFKKISTRKYYVGEHQLNIVINGKILASEKFILNMTN